MRISVWGINYAPELTGIAVYNTDLCNYLAECGEQVTMVTSFPYYPTWRKREEDSGDIYRTDQAGNVLVCRCWTYVPASPSVLKRIIHEASFTATSWLRQLLLPAPDIYVVVSPPLALGLAAWSVSIIKKTPYVFHVQDLQPDAAFHLRMLQGKWLSNLLYWLERLAYDKACLVSGISEKMCRVFGEKSVTPDKIAYFPNWIKVPSPDTLPERGTWKKLRGLSNDTFIVTYAGNLGVKQDIDSILAAAELLKDRQNLLLVIVGNGAKRFEIEKYIADREHKNLLLLDVLPEDEHSQLLIDSDICLVTQKPGSGAAFLPSKLLKILALGRPVITNAEESSPLYDAVATGQFGQIVNPSDAQALARAILDLLSDLPRRERMAESGRQFVAQFERQGVLSGFRSLLQKCVSNKR
jgi:colanic acid biosynthesis glycosyl transferase WcaI